MDNKIQIVRIYLAEDENKIIKSIISYLHDEKQIRGASVFRAISGYGQSGQIHSSDLLYLSLNLPIVIEFFDEPQKIATAIEHIKTLVHPKHIITWLADVI